MIYSEFATFYDELFDNQLYDEWLSFVEKNTEPGISLLDLACGTGRLLVLLKQAGYQVSGADLSDDMLALAQQHLAAAGYDDVPLYNANMLDLTALPDYEAITCFDDSICYLPDLNAVTAMFTQLNQHLNNHGKFLFDVITPYKINVYYHDYMYNYQDDDQAFMWSSFPGEYANSVEHDLTFFAYNTEKNAFDEYEETHFERTYELADYKNALETSGFKNVKVYADFGNSAILLNNTQRWFFVCEKD